MVAISRTEDNRRELSCPPGIGRAHKFQITGKTYWSVVCWVYSSVRIPRSTLRTPADLIQLGCPTEPTSVSSCNRFFVQS